MLTIILDKSSILLLDVSNSTELLTYWAELEVNNAWYQYPHYYS